MSGILPETYVPGFHDEKDVKKMVYEDFGNTGLKVSKISFGTGVFCYAYNTVNEEFIEKCRETLIHALKKGVNYIDTAPYYGHGESEEILGKILPDVPRKAYYIATKVGRYSKDLVNQFNFTAEKIRESVDVSLKRMNLDYIDVLQVHDIEFAPSLDIVLNESLPTVQEFVQSGKAKFIGVTGYPVHTVAECIEKSKIKLDMTLSYARMTMFDHTLSNFIPLFEKKQLAVVNASPNALGLLTNAGEKSWHVATKHIKAVCAEARKLCVQNGVELGNLAIWHSLQQKGPHTNLVGMDSVKIVDNTLNVLQNGLTAKEKEIHDRIIKLFDTKLREKHWENYEVENYWKLMKLVAD